MAVARLNVARQHGSRGKPGCRNASDQTLLVLLHVRSYSYAHEQSLLLGCEQARLERGCSRSLFYSSLVSVCGEKNFIPGDAARLQNDYYLKA